MLVDRMTINIYFFFILNVLSELCRKGHTLNSVCRDLRATLLFPITQTAETRLSSFLLVPNCHFILHKVALICKERASQ